ncbi:MAG TPA: ABC transporter ATP-binding protein [Gemmatimonadales bacterium]|nr:ABC transporter ATP-binding protein [Gemmatimonadales bacterium]
MPNAPSMRGLGVAGALAQGCRMMLQRPWLAAGLLGTTLAQGVLQGLLLVALRNTLVGFDHAGVSRGLGLLLGAVLIYVIWLGRAVTTASAEVLSARLADSVEIAAIKQVMAKLLTLSVRFYDRNRQEDIVLASYHDLKSMRNVTQAVGELVLHGSRMVGLVVVAAMMSPSLTLIGLVIVPLGLLPAHWFGERLLRSAAEQRNAIAALSTGFLHIASGIRHIKLNRGEERVLAQATTNAEAYQRNLDRSTRAAAAARLLFEAVSGLGLVLVLTLGGRDVASGALAWQSLLSLLVAVVAVYSPMVGLLNVYAKVQTNLATLDRVHHIMRSVPEIRDAADARPLSAPPATIELRDVSFTYGTRPALQHVSVTVRRGETIGIVGPSGSGKSTLVALLLRFYDPSQGAILIDGVDIRQIRVADLIDTFALVQQDSFLLQGTVAENIRFSRPEATLAEVIAASKAANLHDEIMEMERGYDTLIGTGPDARGLSGGQRQRLCIAAALLKNAPVLLLDEATSSLDSVSEAAVQVAINRLMLGRTTFMIAHRLSTLRHADRIMVLDEGRLVGLGRDDELLQGCPTFRSLWIAQGGRLRLHETDGGVSRLALEAR